MTGIVTVGEASLGDMLQQLCPFVDGFLIDEEGWERIIDRVGDLPGLTSLSRLLGLEFRLGDPEAVADIFVRVERHSPDWSRHIRHALADRPGSCGAAIGRLFARLDDPGTCTGTPGGARLAAAFLEYDVAETVPGERPDPGLFVPAMRRDEPGRFDLQALDDLITVAGWPDDGALSRAVTRALSCLPEGSGVSNFGALPGREQRAVRLVIGAVAADEVSAMLSGLEWPGPIESVQRALADAAGLKTAFMISLDVDPAGVQPRLGLELYPPKQYRGVDPWLTTVRSDWPPILRHLESVSPCIPEKMAGLRDFSGRDHLFGPLGAFTFYRGINHVKLVIESDRPVHAKGYAVMALFDFGLRQP